MATTTSAATSAVGGTAIDQIGASLGQVFSDPNVVASIGQAGGSIITAGLGAIGINTGPSAAQQEAERLARLEAARARQTQMLIIGGVVASLVVVVIVVVVRRKK